MNKPTVYLTTLSRNSAVEPICARQCNPSITAAEIQNRVSLKSCRGPQPPLSTAGNDVDRTHDSLYAQGILLEVSASPLAPSSLLSVLDGRPF
jgi:hypothetical protein